MSATARPFCADPATAEDEGTVAAYLFRTLLVVWACVWTGAWAQAAPYAAMVMDARSGAVLHEQNADTPLHPASLTKMMTLYVVFEAIENGEIGLDTPVTISRAAAAEPPSKLGLRAGQRIALRYLVRAAAVRSANDAAHALADAIEGGLPAFAARMNRTATALGMTRTHFKNPHGLTQAGHLSTARDMTILGRALFHHYPQYYNLFSRTTADAGVAQVRNTNRNLLSAYAGADGIKTGYTKAAGFNIVASAERDGVRLIATVFGGRSSTWRNQKVAELLDLGFSKASRRVAVRLPARPAYAGPVRAVAVAAVAAAPGRSLRPRARPVAEAAMLAAVQGDIESAVIAANAAGALSSGVAAAAADTTAQAESTPPVALAQVRPAVMPKMRPATLAPAAAAPVRLAAVRPAARLDDLGGSAGTEVALAPSPDPEEAPAAGSLALASADAAAVPGTLEEGQEIVTRASTSGGHVWGVSLGTQPSRYAADTLLLKAALQEIETLSDALRKVNPRPGGFEAEFLGLTESQAERACARLAARGLDCEVNGPS